MEVKGKERKVEHQLGPVVMSQYAASHCSSVLPEIYGSISTAEAVACAKPHCRPDVTDSGSRKWADLSRLEIDAS